MSDEGTELADIPESISDAGSQESSAPAAAVAEAPSSSPDVWSSFRSLPEFKGKADPEIAGRLYAAMQREQAATKALTQYQQLIPYGQEFLRYRENGDWDRFQQWIQAQQQAPRQAPMQPPPQHAPAQKAQGWWNPPAVKESSLRWLVKDENGREQIHPDAPLHIRDELYEYQKYRVDFANKLLTNPQEALGPMVEDRAKAIAQEIVQEQLQQVGEAGYVSNLESENKDWLYNEDGSPSREGLMVQHYIQKASQLGLGTPQQRWEYACDMVERDLLNEVRELDARNAARAQMQASLQAFTATQQADQQSPSEPPREPAVAAPVQNRDSRDMNYLRREASRNPSRSTGAPDPRAPKDPLTFEQRLRAQLARDGLA